MKKKYWLKIYKKPKWIGLVKFGILPYLEVLIVLGSELPGPD